jgi:hypothetical protein
MAHHERSPGTSARDLRQIRTFDRALLGNDDAGVRYHGHLPFEGEIIWLTSAQGGRASGPPATPREQDYAATAIVPPHTVQSGLASFVVRVEDRAAWRSPAFAGWLLVDNSGDQAVAPGTVIVVTEGPLPVAFFRVDYVRADPLPPALRNLDLKSLIGCTDGDARRRVETAGGVLRTYEGENPALTLDLVENRVTARVDAGKIVQVRGLG